MTREMSLASPSSIRDSIYKLWRKFTAPNSTSGLRTGQHWTDDKPIYRTVLILAAGPADSDLLNTAHNITGLGTIVSLSGMMDDGTVQHPVPYVHATNALAFLQMSADNTNIILETGSAANYTSYTGLIVIEYTLA